MATRFAAQWQGVRALTTELLNGSGQLSPEESAHLAALRVDLVKLLRDEMRPEAVEAFEAHQPSYDENEFKRMVERGTQAWAGVPDSAAWVETMRGGKG